MFHRAVRFCASLLVAPWKVARLLFMFCAVLVPADEGDFIDNATHCRWSSRIYGIRSLPQAWSLQRSLLEGLSLPVVTWEGHKRAVSKCFGTLYLYSKQHFPMTFVCRCPGGMNRPDLDAKAFVSDFTAKPRKNISSSGSLADFRFCPCGLCTLSFRL